MARERETVPRRRATVHEALRGRFTIQVRSCRGAGVAVDLRPTSRSPFPTLKIEPEPRSRPLLVREGAHYDCFGDGTCCTDIHALGPVTRTEQRAVELLEPGSLIRHKD